MKFQSACFNNKGEEIKNVSKQFNLEGLFDLFLFFYFLESVSHLPSLLVLLSNVTAFTRSRTSFQVLNPSQWARQTAPLPDKEIQLFNQESFNHQSINHHHQKERERIFWWRTVYQYVEVLPNDRWWHHLIRSLTHSLEQTGHDTEKLLILKIINLERRLSQWG